MTATVQAAAGSHHDSHDRHVLRLGAVCVMAVLIIEAITNAMFGFRIMGIPMAAISICIALFGAMCGIWFRQVDSREPMAQQRRIMYAIPLAFCLAYSQVAGWSVFATYFADASVGAGVQASTREVAQRELKRLEGLQDAAGTTRPPAVIKAEIDAQLAIVLKGARRTVGEVSGNCSEAAAAPTVCRSVNKLKTELAKAEDATTLPEKIAAAMKGVQAAPQRAGAGTHLQFIASVFPGSSVEDVKFWITLGIVGLVGMIANFGPALCGIGAVRHPPAYPPAYAHQQLLQAPPGWAPAPARWSGDGYHPAAGVAPPPRPQGPPSGVAGGMQAPQFDDRAERYRADGSPASIHGAPTSLHGAPIHINVSAQPHPNGGAPAGIPVAVHAPPAGSAVAPAEQPALPRRPSVPALTASTTAQAPVQRTRLREMIDQLMTFEAACLVAAPGRHLPAEAVWERYRQWAGGRSISRQAFLETYPEYSEIATAVTFGGELTLQGIDLRPAQLQAVPA